MERLLKGKAMPGEAKIEYAPRSKVRQQLLGGAKRSESVTS